jgi:hypothetical protein
VSSVKSSSPKPDICRARKEANYSINFVGDSS